MKNINEQVKKKVAVIVQQLREHACEVVCKSVKQMGNGFLEVEVL